MIMLATVVALIVMFAVVLAFGYARQPEHTAYTPQRPHLTHLAGNSSSFETPPVEDRKR